MPRAEKRVIECFVAATDAQILQSILDLVHVAGKNRTLRTKRVRTRLVPRPHLPNDRKSGRRARYILARD